MTEIIDFKYGLCVKWTTSWPDLGTPCKSSNICIRQDSSWFLKLRFVNDFNFYLELCNGCGRDLETPLEVTSYLRKLDGDSTPILCQHKLFDNCGTKIWYEIQRIFSDTTRNILKNGNFIIICIFHYSTGAEHKKQVSTQTDMVSTHTVSTNTIVDDNVSTHLQSFSRDLSCFLVDQTFSDVKLKCGDSTFSAHKSILAARSEVFAAMFRNKMTERETGTVEIQDLDPKVLEPFLQYMYSGKMPVVSPDMFRPLYEAADKYAVYVLRKSCSQFMLEALTPEDCLDLLVLGDKHSDEDFKEETSRFIEKNLHLLDRESWSAFRKEHPGLAVQVYDKSLADVLSRQT